MSIKSIRIYSLALAAIVFLAPSLLAQVEVDVKTKWLEKHELTVAKGGVIAAIEADPSIATTEFGEDYALWLKNLRRGTGAKDTVILKLDLELRKPSLVSEGELIAKKTIELRYDPHMLDSLYALEGMSETIANRRQEYDAWNRLIGTAVGALVPKGGFLIGPIVTMLLQQVNASPKPEEICEGVLIGANVVEWLNGSIGQ